MAKHRKRSPSKARYYITGLSILGITFSSTPPALATSDAFPNAITEDIWDRLAECESSGDWDIDTGNGYAGGLQFAPTTWSGFGGLAYASSADEATRQEQIAIATRVQKSQGWNAWPTCTKRLGISGDPGTSPNAPSVGAADRNARSGTATVPRASSSAAPETKSASASTNPKCIELKASGTKSDELDELSTRNPGWGLDGDGNGVPCEVTFPRESTTSAPQPVSESSRVSSSAPTTNVGSAITSGAREWLGTPYKWGGVSTSGVDCSGLVVNVLADLGIKAPRTSTAQSQWVTKVSRSEARAGDLVFNAGRVHHVGIYIGDGMMIDSPKPGTKVGVHKLYKDMTVFGRVPT